MPVPTAPPAARDRLAVSSGSGTVRHVTGRAAELVVHIVRHQEHINHAGAGQLDATWGSGPVKVFLRRLLDAATLEG